MGLRVRDRVRDWDDEAFSKLTRSIQLSLVDGNLDRAHRQLDAFAQILMASARKVLELGDSVAQLVDPEIAGLLQRYGYENIASVVYASDSDLLSIPMLGKGRLAKIRDALVEYGFSQGTRKKAVLTPA